MSLGPAFILAVSLAVIFYLCSRDNDGGFA